MALINKKYGDKFILNDVDFELKKGRIVGLTGRNGSGKTTLMKCLIGIIQGSDKRLNNVSYLSDSSSLFDFKILDLVSFYDEVYDDFSKDKFFKLSKLMKIDVDNLKGLSFGEKRKLKMLLVLSREVDYYILDEPFTEIDVFSIDEVISVILNAIDFEKSGLLISDHNIDILERLVDDIVFLKDGKAFYCENLDVLKGDDTTKSLVSIYKEIEGF